MTSVSAGHIIPTTTTQPVGSGRQQREPGTSSPGVAISTDRATAPHKLAITRVMIRIKIMKIAIIMIIIIIIITIIIIIMII